MNLRPIQDGDFQTALQNPRQKSLKHYPHLTAPAYGWTCEDNGRIVGMGGIVVFWKGVGEAWIIVCDDNDASQGAQVYWTLAGQLGRIVAEERLWRVEAQVRTDFPDAIRLVKLLGFEQEGLRRHFAPDGQDMILFAKVYDEHLPNSLPG